MAPGTPGAGPGVAHALMIGAPPSTGWRIAAREVDGVVGLRGSERLGERAVGPTRLVVGDVRGQRIVRGAAVAGEVVITRAMLAGLMIMFGLMGNVMGKVRRNFWVGVRTPWTLASDRVWNDTHRLAGQLFVGAAVIGAGAPRAGGRGGGVWPSPAREPVATPGEFAARA